MSDLPTPAPDTEPSPSLRRSLDAAADTLPRLDIAGVVAVRVERVRRRRRVVAGVAGVGLVATTVGAVALLPGLRDVPPAEPSAPAASSSVAPIDGLHLDPKWPEEAGWDPGTARDLPLTPWPDGSIVVGEGVPVDSVMLADEPLPDGALAAVPGHDGAIAVLGGGGEWRSIPSHSGSPLPGWSAHVQGSFVLAGDGRSLAALTGDGIEIVDMATGRSRSVDWPTGMDGGWHVIPSLRWLGDGWVLTHFDREWSLRAAGSGWSASRAAPPSASLVATDVVPGTTGEVGSWQGSPDGYTITNQTGRPTTFAVGAERVLAVGTLGATPAERRANQHVEGPVVLDRSSADLVATLPTEGLATNAVTPCAVLDNSRAVLSVVTAGGTGGAGGTGRGAPHLVLWNYEAMTLSRLDASGMSGAGWPSCHNVAWENIEF